MKKALATLLVAGLLIGVLAAEDDKPAPRAMYVGKLAWLFSKPYNELTTEQLVLRINMELAFQEGELKSWLEAQELAHPGDPGLARLRAEHEALEREREARERHNELLNELRALQR
jgi:hypothetical protein